MRLEDYALIGDTQTAALVGNDGPIDRLCRPRSDPGPCFANLRGAFYVFEKDDFHDLDSK